MPLGVLSVIRGALISVINPIQLSVVEYDPGTHDLKTLSLHYFEEPELRDGFVQNLHTPQLRVGDFRGVWVDFGVPPTLCVPPGWFVQNVHTPHVCGVDFGVPQ
ncbi:PREDICTED: cleavage and polyadenylation specificity factor subunit 1 [Lepidothrix coronata]|uniref:Cleavage and polyadenylation specificity factor subunit 1 n=1 Tax=Lepidothrix coronata TaxID=321398 RepID=A0A6J0GEI5_9PASS|nr:PREDICTED: cleavage and polyadenylation specificity factor subunit 1 [Lepidothrix coronata]